MGNELLSVFSIRSLPPIGLRRVIVTIINNQRSLKKLKKKSYKVIVGYILSGSREGRSGGLETEESILNR